MGSGFVLSTPIRWIRNNGKDYPPSVLLGWKAAHEFRIAREHGAMLYPFGWVESLHIIDAPVFKPDQRIVFANANLIIGDNDVGKTTICEWLSSLKDSSKLSRWGAYPSWTAETYDDVHVAIDLRAPDRQHLKLDIQGGCPTFTLEEQKFPFCPIAYEVVYIRAPDRLSNFAESDQEFLAKCLQMDETSVQALADHITENPGIFLNRVEWVEDDEKGSYGVTLRRLYCVVPNGKFSLRLLGSSATGAVLVDLAIAKAKILARKRPTLLIIEASSFSWAGEFLSMFLNELSSPRMPFQSIVVVSTEAGDAVWGGWWGGWQDIRLIQPPGDGLTEILIGAMHGGKVG
jgi:hypothetical protein